MKISSADINPQDPNLLGIFEKNIDREQNKLIWVFSNSEPFDELKMAYVTEYRNMQAAALDAALAKVKSA